jgi:hypothetical protein
MFFSIYFRKPTMQSTTEELPKLTRQEKWRVYDNFYKQRKYASDPEFRQRVIDRASAHYYKKRAEKATAVN